MGNLIHLFYLEPKNRSSLVEHSRKQEKYERSLTVKEIEYLEFFTDFCKYLNDPADYGITPSSVASANFKTKFLGNEATKEDIEELDQNLL